jgi:protein ImuB
LQVTAVDAAAAAEGLRPGMTLAHARALVPHVRVATADPVADAAALHDLAQWACRYTPWAAPDGDDGLMLDVSGCAHLFGGEAALIADLRQRLARLGIATRAAIADTPAAAWAWAHYGEARIDAIVPEGAAREKCAPLPVAALRLPPVLVESLHQLGLRRVDDVIGLPRAPLARRFGVDIGRRIDRLLGRESEPISPVMPPPVWETRLAFPEPIVHRDGVVIALERLLARLCDLLQKAGQGARKLTLVLTRVDCTAQRITVGTSGPVREAAHLARLFAERLDTVDAGFGIETVLLAASEVEAVTPRQEGFAADQSRHNPHVLTELVDRLENRFGAGTVKQIVAVESHIPERAARMMPVDFIPSPERGGLGRGRFADNTKQTNDPHLTSPFQGEEKMWPSQDSRPLTLLPSPEPIAALAPVPDDPPLSFTWRRVIHRVARAEGPERIEPEWWRARRAEKWEPVFGKSDAPSNNRSRQREIEIALSAAQALPDRRRTRDYYRVEDTQGRRFWIFREGLYGLHDPRWFMHGLFA